MVTTKVKRIALITDVHTGLEGETPFAVDLRKNFRQILEVIKTKSPDLLVLGGDLCLRDGDLQIYRWQKSKLDALNIPYLIIAGNHDNPGLLTRVFENLQLSQDGEIYYRREFAGHVFLFLDTHKGFLSQPQKNWLKQQLAICEKSNVTIFMHHPPDLMNVPHMDRDHHLRDRIEVMEILVQGNVSANIFCGHYHVEKSVTIGLLNIFITPSCYFQIDDAQHDFSIAHKNIAYRIIDLYADRIEHMVHYLPGNVAEDSSVPKLTV